MEDYENEPEAPGWDAITVACSRIYGAQEPKHTGTIISSMLGGPDPIDGMSVYDAGGHWHYVSYGLTELYEKETDDAEWSGLGYEFTFRLAKESDSDDVPEWPWTMFQNLARYAFNDAPLGQWDTMGGPGSITPTHPQSVKHALLFVEDPELGSIETPNGKVLFLQIVGISTEERRLAGIWSGAGLEELLKTDSPLLVTDLNVPDRTALPRWKRLVDEGRANDGSSKGGFYDSALEAERVGTKTVITLDGSAGSIVPDVLPGRLPFGRTFKILGHELRLIFGPAEDASIEHTEDTIVVSLSDSQCTEVASRFRSARSRGWAAKLKPKWMKTRIVEFEFLPDVAFRLVEG